MSSAAPAMGGSQRAEAGIWLTWLHRACRAESPEHKGLRTTGLLWWAFYLWICLSGGLALERG